MGTVILYEVTDYYSCLHGEAGKYPQIAQITPIKKERQWHARCTKQGGQLDLVFFLSHVDVDSHDRTFTFPSA